MYPTSARISLNTFPIATSERSGMTVVTHRAISFQIGHMRADPSLAHGVLWSLRCILKYSYRAHCMPRYWCNSVVLGRCRLALSSMNKRREEKRGTATELITFWMYWWPLIFPRTVTTPSWQPPPDSYWSTTIRDSRSDVSGYVSINSMYPHHRAIMWCETYARLSNGIFFTSWDYNVAVLNTTPTFIVDAFLTDLDVCWPFWSP